MMCASLDDDLAIKMLLISTTIARTQKPNQQLPLLLRCPLRPG
jgi:hypothetical protein